MRRLGTWLTAALLCFALSSPGTAQTYPTRPITIVVPFSAGGGPDILGRRVAASMQAALGQPVVVENRVGAGGRVGTEAVARAAPDGYTILLGTSSSLVIAPALYKDLAYDSEKSFAPIGLAVYGPLILGVRSSLQIADLKSLLAYAKNNPNKLNFASTGTGSVHHLAGELLKQATGVEMTHIAYRGGAPAWLAVASGETDLMMDALFGGAIPLIQAGTVRVLAVTGNSRLSALPDVPTFNELGVAGVDVSFWWGFLAPAGTPAPVVARLNETLVVALSDPDLKSTFADQSLDLKASTQDEFDRLIHDNLALWRGVVEKAAIKPE
jgi:tripartite-type tricarboxylate transporter receptor subunit TctC